jgi:hypothetical protein
LYHLPFVHCSRKKGKEKKRKEKKRKGRENKGKENRRNKQENCYRYWL